MKPITEELRAYIDMCREEEVINEETDAMLHEMARVSNRLHGIPGVIIWVGDANKRHGLRVKISNSKDRWNNEDNFIIRMPSLDYDPAQVAKWIDSKTMNQILTWIKLNQSLLYAYENGEIDDTSEFLAQLSKI